MMNILEDYRTDDGRGIKEAAMTGSSRSEPIFTLKKFEWEKKSTKSGGDYKARVIYSVAVSSNTIIIATSQNAVLRWNVTEGHKEPDRIEIPAKPDDHISKVFIDFTGHHVLIVMKSGDNYYLHSRSQRPKKIPSKLQGTIQCVAFDKLSSTESSTKSFLVGTSLGMIYEMALDFAGKEKVCQLVFKFEQPIPITSIYFDVLSSGAAGGGSSAGAGMGGRDAPGSSVSSDSRGSAGGGSGGGVGLARLFVMWATSSPTRLYHFSGGPTFQALFATCTHTHAHDGGAPFTELPGEMLHAELHCYTKGTLSRGGGAGSSQAHSGRAQNFALMSEVGIYHGSLLFASSSGSNSGENVILEAQHLPYVDPSPLHQYRSGSLAAAARGGEVRRRGSEAGLHPPLSLGITDYHFLVLRNDRLQVLSSLNGALVQEELLGGHADGPALGILLDQAKKNMWLYTSNSIYQVNASEEDKHVWKVYLDRAVAAGDDKLFDAAFSYSKTQAQRQQIMRARAAHCTREGRVDLAAVYYAQAGISFDEVALRLLNCIDSAGNVTSIASGGAGLGGTGGVLAGTNTRQPGTVGGSGFCSITSPHYPEWVAANNQARDGALLAGADLSVLAANHHKQQQSPPRPQQIVSAALTVGAPLTPLRVFLLHTLKVLPAGAKMQRAMLCTWLCDIFLHQIAVAPSPAAASSSSATTSIGKRRKSNASSSSAVRRRDSSASSSAGTGGGGTASEEGAYTEGKLDKEELLVEFKDFLRAHRSVLDVPTTLQLIVTRNDTALLLFYSQIVGDYHRVVALHMAQKRYSEVINVLAQAPLEKVLQLIYKTAPVLIEWEPEATVNMLLSKPQLSLKGIMPALLRYSGALDRQRYRRQLRRERGHREEEDDEEGEVPLDRDFEGNPVNFAVKYLRELLRGHGFRFSGIRGDGSAEEDDEQDAADSAAYVGLRSSILDGGGGVALGIGADGAGCGAGPEPALFHTLTWLLCRYEDGDGDSSVLVRLLRTLHEIKQGIFSPSSGAAEDADEAEGTGEVGGSGAYTSIPVGSGISCDGGLTAVELDYDYLLRQCRLNDKRRAAVYGLLLLGRPQLAVVEALQLDFALAKKLAMQQPQGEHEQQQGLDAGWGAFATSAYGEAAVLGAGFGLAGESAGQGVRKLMWLEVARHMLETGADPRAAIALIADSNGALTIDDLLPMLPDVTELELFQEEICQSLQACGDQVQALKSTMQELAGAAETAVQELESMKNRAYSMGSPHQQCEFCAEPLFGSRQFYLFPCSHGFHAHCLLQHVPKQLNPAQRAAVQGVEEALRGLAAKVRAGAFGGDPGDRRLRVQEEALQQELEGYIAADCPLCGYLMIECLDVPLVRTEDAAEAKTWQL